MQSSQIKIAQATFDQIARYNMTLNADYLMVTNGMNHYFCQMDFENENINFCPNSLIYLNNKDEYSSRYP
jgi:hypothetical protein